MCVCAFEGGAPRGTPFSPRHRVEWVGLSEGREEKLWELGGGAARDGKGM